MKNAKWILLVTALVWVLAVGVSFAEQPKASEPPKPPVQSYKDKLKDKMEALKELWKKESAEMKERLAPKIDEANKKIEELKEKAKGAEGDAKKDLEKTIAALKIKTDAAKAKMKEMEAASPGKWEKVKEKIHSTLDDLHKSVDDAINKHK